MVPASPTPGGLGWSDLGHSGHDRRDLEMGRPYRSLELGALGDHDEVGTSSIFGERDGRGQPLI